MPLPPFEKLIEIEVPTEKRDKIDYLNWAKCVELLHENGAKVVWFEPICNENGSSLFMSNQVFTDNKGNTNRCYEVKVHIKIDDLEFDMNHPLMNGANPVKDNSLSQQRVWNAQTRAFVKGVAIRTGLGFKLWIKDDSSAEEDLSKHSISKIRQRVLEKMTSLMKSGLSKDDVDQKLEENKVTETAIYEFIGKGKGTFDKYNRLYILLDAFEKALDKL